MTSAATATRPALKSWLEAGPYQGYCYSYPHKTAYREFPAQPLQQVWTVDQQSSALLYVHLPFCEFRCGFCNLFTYSQPPQELVLDYLDAFERQLSVVAQCLPDFQYSQIVFGGGTPSYLSESELDRLLGLLEKHLRGKRSESTFEVSPATVTPAKLQLLKSFGIRRISMGVQSFSASELAALGRPQKREQVVQAIHWIQQHGFELNLDLIYSGKQTSDSWQSSLQEVLRFEPAEIYLYPLYVRQKTGLGNRDGLQLYVQQEQWQPQLERYHQGQQILKDSGYKQMSMRMFRRQEKNGTASQLTTEIQYQCQRDGMLGLGSGARSYTDTLHYGSRFAVRQSAVLSEVQRYTELTDEQFAHVDFGFQLDESEQRRRHLLLTLFQVSGVNKSEFQKRFGVSLLTAFPELESLNELELANETEEEFLLNEKGLAWSDAIAPWLYSLPVSQLMEQFPWNDA